MGETGPFNNKRNVRKGELEVQSKRQVHRHNTATATVCHSKGIPVPQEGYLYDVYC